MTRMALFAVIALCLTPGTGLRAADGKDRAAQAQALLKSVKAPDGWKVTLFASPPDISYPTAIAATPDGVLYVGVDKNGSLGKSPNMGRIVRCIDTDGDGVADMFNDFAKIEAVRGLYVDGNKVWVLNPPTFRVLTDTDGDGVADKDEVLVDGMESPALKQRGVDHSTNGFRVGIDGWAYIAVGDFGWVKATGKDGKSVQFLGGGVARVRLDGTELEIVSHGQRNIYDVAVSPTLDLFTRDNTNDGGGWNVRLTHVVRSGQYGYPSWFKNFADEILQPMADYGGGSPTGALFTDEPALGGEYARSLYTVEWGRNAIMRHPLTREGASYKAEQETFLTLPRPTDMDVDAMGNLYVASWKDGGFRFSKDEVGFIVRVTRPNRAQRVMPDLSRMDHGDVITLLASGSGVRRQAAQNELLRRGDAPGAFSAIAGIVSHSDSIESRIAAIFTLKQLFGNDDATRGWLLNLLDDPTVREYALHALADRLTETNGVPADVFIKALRDPNPRVRLKAAWGLGRLGNVQTAPALLAALRDQDATVAHVALESLVKLRAIDASLTQVDSTDDTHAQDGLRVLRRIHDEKVVDSLIDRLASAGSAERKSMILSALCRLYHVEAEWKGQWWGTRPDTSGPYYRHATWSQSDKIAAVLKKSLEAGDDATRKALLVDLNRHKIALKGTTARLVEAGLSDASFAPRAVAMLVELSGAPREGVPLYEKVALADESDNATRALALRGLHKAGAYDPATRAVVKMIASGKTSRDLTRAINDFLRDPAHAKRLDALLSDTLSRVSAEREVAYMTLLNLGANNRVKRSDRAAALKLVNMGWQQPTTTVNLLDALTRTGSRQYASAVMSRLKDKDEIVRKAAQRTARALRLDANKPAGPLIGSMQPSAVRDAVAKIKGDAKLGEHLFLQQGCAACHTVSPKEAPKGPPLAGIAARYSRAELTESIVAPSAKVAQGFDTQVIETLDGDQIIGFVTREAGDTVELRNANGDPIILKKADIDSRRKADKSVMPDGLVKGLTVDELAALLAYLESLKGK